MLRTAFLSIVNKVRKYVLICAAPCSQIAGLEVHKWCESQGALKIAKI